MEAAIAQLQAVDSQDRIAAVKKLQTLLEQNQKGLSATDVGTLLNGTVDLLKDNDHIVCQGALQVLASAASLAGERLNLDFVALLPAIVNRLGDEKASVRDAGRGLLLALMQIFTPSVVLERVSSHALRHKNWKVRDEFARIIASAIKLFEQNELPLVQLLRPMVSDLLEDSNINVKESTMILLEQIYQHRGHIFKDELQCFSLRPSQIKEINSRFEKLESKVCTCGPAKGRSAAASSDNKSKPTAGGSYWEKHASAAAARNMGDTSSGEQPSVHVDVHLSGNNVDSVLMTFEDAEGNIKKGSRKDTAAEHRCCNPNAADATAAAADEDGVGGMMSLDETLTESLSKKADWSVRVSAFNFIKKLYTQGPKGLQEITQSLDSILRLLQEHLSDPHHKVSQAALSTLVLVIKSYKKQFGTFLEMLLPRIFPPLVDSREDTGELAASALQVIGNTYDIKLLFPALLRSLDEQRSPKSKIAVIEYAIGAFVKLDFNFEVIGPLLRVWLGKLALLARSRHPKLKETSLLGIIAVYSHLDTIIVLEFILALPVDEQTVIRRALKQYVPQIEVDILYHLRYRRQRVTPSVRMDDSETITTTTKKPYVKSVFTKVKACDKDPPNPFTIDRSGVHEGMTKHLKYNCRTPKNTGDPYENAYKIREYNTGWDVRTETTRRWLDVYNVEVQAGGTTNDGDGLMKKVINWGADKPSEQKHESLLAAIQLYKSNDIKIWIDHFDKLVAVVLQAVKDADEFSKAAALSVAPEMLNQIVSKLPEDVLTKKLPTFLPLLLDAFGSQHEDVRKAVLFCLVDVYVVLGKSFLPYLSSLNAMQLQLVTSYATRITQCTNTADEYAHPCSGKALPLANGRTPVIYWLCEIEDRAWRETNSGEKVSMQNQ